MKNLIPILNVEDRQIFQLLSDQAKNRQVNFTSCLDIGCGMNPVDKWFRSYVKCSDAPYYAIDTHPEVKQELKSRQIEVMSPDEISSDFRADLVTAQEVIEHIQPSEVVDFCKYLRQHTGKVLALTCPNFVGFDPILHRANEPELRFVPDHLKNFCSTSSDPYIHKTATTPEMIRDILMKVFPESDWSINIYQAWPWLLTDISTKSSYFVYFKVFALVWYK